MFNILDVCFIYFLYIYKFFICILMFYIIIFIIELVICCLVKLFKDEFCEMKFYEV